MADEEGEYDSKKQEEERASELFHWACHHPIGIIGTSLVQVDIWLFKQRAQCFLSGLFVGCAVVEQRTTVRCRPPMISSLTHASISADI